MDGSSAAIHTSLATSARSSEWKVAEMTSKIVTDWARDLAERLQMVVSIGVGIDAGDVTQLIDLADTLDDERKEEQAAEVELAELIKGAIRDTAS